MERTKNPNLLTWYNSGGGIHRLKGGKIVKPHETFKAPKSQLTKVQLNIFKLVSGNLETVEDKEIPVAIQSEYEVRKRETSNFYDVVRVSDGKVENEKALRKDAAEELKASLE